MGVDSEMSWHSSNEIFFVGSWHVDFSKAGQKASGLAVWEAQMFTVNSADIPDVCARDGPSNDQG